ncbi:MAG: alpha/beta fold hydrolase [Dysgonomonas mossii]|uniref:alpha/beta hydrolase n=1 Tax=Dysgonomonas mossii TaxID=163665 RepID=UPI001DC6FAAE|nr:alpha/beta fold hydrolase [Dysgonomonas mossii]MBS5797307.1 alpha/beta fold hydrolase [Dysgonomonas mossii]MBS7111350.1 alpha/beta fold hydrolase [Dysgonomonas mossii]
MIRKQKKYIKISIGAIMTVFLLINIAIITQAYKLTHFSESAKPLSLNYKPTTSEMIKIAVCGLDIARPTTKQHPNCSYKSVYIYVDEGKQLEAWLLHTDSLKQGIALAFHGYMDEKSSMLDRAYALLNMGYDVLLVDFMGAGGSYGNQSTIGYLEANNVKACYDYVIKELKEDKIIMIGFSMGAAAIMKAQHDYNMQVSALILEAGYATFKGTVNKRLDRINIPHWPASQIFTFWTGVINGFNAFDANPLEFGKDIHIPTLLMCGGKDPNIPKEETQFIFDQLGSNKKELVFFPESAHETYLDKYSDKWKDVVSHFLQEINSLDVYSQ